MKTRNPHHEILLFTSTGLANRRFISLEGNENGKPVSAHEELERACWNGIIFEMFPEIFGSYYPKCESFLWNVLAGKKFICISIGPNPISADSSTSIDPYFFMITTCEN